MREKLLATWTWNHKLLIVTMALTLALLIETDIIVIPTFPNEAIAYEKPFVDTSLEAKVEKRAMELYVENRAFDLEKYRQEAIREVGDELMRVSDVSPYVDYQALEKKYGY